MGCVETKIPGGVMFSCGRARDRKPCTVPGCTGNAAKACTFKLAGKKAGKACGRALCERHAIAGARGVRCAPHAGDDMLGGDHG